MGVRDLILTTARLTVTTWLPRDVEELIVLHSDAVVMSQMITGTETRGQTRARIDQWIEEQCTRGWAKWRVSNRSGNLLGRAGFGMYHRTGDREIGYLLRRDAWGQGLATELAAALVEWHRQHPDPTISTRLRGYAYDTNVASQRVLLKAGFRPAGKDLVDPRQLCFIHERRRGVTTQERGLSAHLETGGSVLTSDRKSRASTATEVSRPIRGRSGHA